MAGQLVLVGFNLSHHWISDLEPDEVVHDRDLVFRFHPDWVRRCQTVLPEPGGISSALKKSAQGIAFTGATAQRSAVELRQIGVTTGWTTWPATSACPPPPI